MASLLLWTAFVCLTERSLEVCTVSVYSITHSTKSDAVYWSSGSHKKDAVYPNGAYSFSPLPVFSI